MSDKPLQPFHPPASLTTFVPNGISASTVIEILLGIVFVFWVIYTLVAIYHWIKYSHGSWAAFPAIVLHLFVSLVLMAYALSGAFIL